MELSREDRLRGPFEKSHRLIEIGPSYNPIVPKAEGWSTTVVDHAPREALIDKYSRLGCNTDRIEEVDVVLTGGDLVEAIPRSQHGTFDGLIASHVVEHLPDLLGFLKSLDRLLAPHGTVALAVPDRRLCFNFFQSPTLTGDLLAAHAEQRTQHTRRTFFNETAYNVSRNNQIAWEPNRERFCFTGSLATALA